MHAWVEAWDKGSWSFVDPGEYRPLNDTWFYPYPARLQVMGSPRCYSLPVSQLCLNVACPARSDASGTAFMPAYSICTRCIYMVIDRCARMRIGHMEQHMLCLQACNCGGNI